MRRNAIRILGGVILLLTAAGVRTLSADPAAETASAGQGPARWRAGMAAATDGLYPVAEREFQAALRVVMEDPRQGPLPRDAWVRLAHVMLAQNRAEALLDFIEKNRRWLRREEPGVEPFLRAMVAYQSGQPQEVLRTLARHDRDFPDHPFAPNVLRLTAWSHWQLGATNQALRLFEAYDAAFPGSPEAAANRVEWGQMLIAAGDFTGAEAVLRALPPDDPDPRHRAVAEYWRARLLLETGRPAEAAAMLETLVEADLGDPDLFAEAWFGLAQARLAAGDRPGALSALHRGLVLARGSELLLRGSRRLGMLYLELGRIDEGATLLRHFVTAAPQHPRAAETQMTVAQALLDDGRFVEAHEAFQYYLESFTNQAGMARAYLGRGWALEGLGRHAEAAVSFERAYAGFTADADREVALGKMADAHFADQRYQLARSVYQRLLDEYPDSSQAGRARYQIAQCLALGGQVAEAESAYQTLADMDPATPLAEESLLRLAQLREANTQWVAAVEAYGIALARFPEGGFAADARLGRGQAHFRLFQFADALADFDIVVRLFARSTQAEEAWFHGVRCRYLLGEEAVAVAGGHQFLERYPQSPLAPRMRFWLGQLAFNAGNYDEAERLFMAFEARHPEDPDRERALIGAARAAARSEEYLRSLERLTLYLRDYPAGVRLAEARFEQGNALAALGKFSEAILAYQEIVNRAPRSEWIAETWLRIGDCQFMLGIEDPSRYTAAMQAYRAAISLAGTALDLRLQAEYKIGRCLQRLGRPGEAIDQFYRQVLTRFLEARDAGELQSDAARTWCGRAARELADLFEERQEWRQVVNVLERAVQAGVPDEAGLRERIRDIRSRQWWEFY